MEFFLGRWNQTLNFQKNFLSGRERMGGGGGEGLGENEEKEREKKEN